MAMYPFTAEEVLLDNHVALRLACETGSLEVLKWLVEVFDFRKSLVNTGMLPFYFPFLDACYGGHLEVAQWLVDSIPLSSSDVQVYPYIRACDNRQLHVAKWLTDKFSLTGETELGLSLPHLPLFVDRDILRWPSGMSVHKNPRESQRMTLFA